MCTYIISQTKYRGCPASCTRNSAPTLVKCSDAEQSGVTCDNPGTSYTGQTTSRAQCPNHRDEGYSQR